MAKTATATKPAPIHHATMKKANDNDVTFEEVKQGFRAVHGDSGKKAIAASAREALDKVLNLVESDEESDVESEEGEEEGTIIVKEKYKKIYQLNGGNCGDKLAKALTTFRTAEPKKAFMKVCQENKIGPDTWIDKNHGLQWMALSNVLRARIKRKEEVTIDGQPVKTL